MKQGQIALGLVILGVVTIIAVIGLVLLFTRAGTSGAAILQSPQQDITQQLRSPAFLITGGKADFYYLPYCEISLQTAGIPVPHNQFNCYVLSNRLDASEPGEYYYTSERGKNAQDTTLACYANSISIKGTEADVRETIFTRLVNRDSTNPELRWTSTIHNGVNTPVCWISEHVLQAP